MSFEKRMGKTFEKALRLPLSAKSRYVLVSDCHRGTGNANDNFLKNEYLYIAALKYYEARKFTYLELGDGDELWENRSFRKIKELHAASFSVLADYYRDGRLYLLYGNHDIIKGTPYFPRKYLETCLCCDTCQEKNMFPGITFYPGIILEDEMGQRDIYLTHGHQADMLNSTFWRASRFLVRYVWRPLERLGIPDPTSAAKNNTRKKTSEERLSCWAREKECLLITGHTHHPMAGEPGGYYLNTGSCVSPAGITVIEICGRTLSLVKWSLGTRPDQGLYAARQVLGAPFPLEECCRR